MRVVAWNVILTVVFLIVGDLFYTHLFLTNPEKRYRIAHPLYHHSLKPSFYGLGKWRNGYYRVCTDENGFKTDCKKKLAGTEFDMAFIGDSFTEAIGMTYPNSFVGMFASANPGLNVANLAVSSYSPTIYLAKVKALLNSGYKFSHLTVFIDISDIQDEAISYRLLDDHTVASRTPVQGALKAANSLSPWRSWLPKNFSLLYSLYRYSSEAFSSEKLPRFRDERSAWTYDQQTGGYGAVGVEGAIHLSLQSMRKLSDLLKERGIKLSVGVYPWPAQIFHDTLRDNRQSLIWKKFCESRCQMFIDTFPRFYQLVKKHGPIEVYRDLFIERGYHFNRNGNQLVFEEIMKEYEAMTD